MDNVNKILLLPLLLFLLLFQNLHSQNQRDIRVGVYNNYPKVYIDKKGNVAGIFPETLQLIANKEGWILNYVIGTWDQGLQRLENGEIDIMVDVALSDIREEKYDFNLESVLISWGCVYTRAGNDVNTILDLDGKTIAVMKNSILTNGVEGIVNLAERYGIKCKFIEVDDYYEVFRLLSNGEVDAGVTNRHFGAAFKDQYNVKKTNFIFFPTQLRFAFPKNSPRNKYLISRIDENLEKFKENPNSDYYIILAKYNLYPKKGIPQWLLPVILGLFGIIIFFFIVYLILRWRIRQKTRALKNTNETLKQEIAEHLKTLEKLKVSREIYRNFVENIPGLVYMYDVDHNGNRVPIIKTNRNEEFLGRELAQKVEEDYNSFFDQIVDEDKQRIQKDSEKIEKSGQVFDNEYRVNINDNQISWFRSIGRVKKLSDGKLRWQGVMLDINQRKKIEQELDLHRGQLEKLVESRTQDLAKKTKELEKANIELREADRLKSIFLASMSHELRTPLNSIIGFTGILLMGMVGELSDEQKRQLKIVKESANHLLELINDILDISKIEAGKVELHEGLVNVNVVIQEVVDSFEHKAIEKGLILETYISEDIMQYTDRRRFKQIIINLMGNAVKFTEKGKVSIHVELSNQDEIEIVISDTGIGIKKEDMSKLFEPFQQIDSSLTKKHEGTGLGLHLTQKIMALLHGKIYVESTPGVGTTFILTFPHIIKEANETNTSD